MEKQRLNDAHIIAPSSPPLPLLQMVTAMVIFNSIFSVPAVWLGVSYSQMLTPQVVCLWVSLVLVARPLFSESVQRLGIQMLVGGCISVGLGLGVQLVARKAVGGVHPNEDGFVDSTVGRAVLLLTFSTPVVFLSSLHRARSLENRFLSMTFIIIFSISLCGGFNIPTESVIRMSKYLVLYICLAAPISVLGANLLFPTPQGLLARLTLAKALDGTARLIEDVVGLLVAEHGLASGLAEVAGGAGAAAKKARLARETEVAAGAAPEQVEMAVLGADAELGESKLPPPRLPLDPTLAALEPAAAPGAAPSVASVLSLERSVTRTLGAAESSGLGARYEVDLYRATKLFPHAAFGTLLLAVRSLLSAAVAVVYPLQEGMMDVSGCRACHAELREVARAAAQAVRGLAGVVAGNQPPDEGLEGLLALDRAVKAVGLAVERSWAEAKVQEADRATKNEDAGKPVERSSQPAWVGLQVAAMGLYTAASRAQVLFQILPGVVGVDQPGVEEKVLRALDALRESDQAEPTPGELCSRAVSPGHSRPQSPRALAGRSLGASGEQEDAGKEEVQEETKKELENSFAGAASPQALARRGSRLSSSLAAPPLPSAQGSYLGSAVRDISHLPEVDLSRAAARGSLPVYRAVPLAARGARRAVRWLTSRTGVTVSQLKVATQLSCIYILTMLTVVVSPIFYGFQRRSVWVAISAMLVAESTTGSSVRKGLLRVLGGVGGCAAGILVIVLSTALNGWSHDNSAWRLVAASFFLTLFESVNAALAAWDASRTYAYFTAAAVMTGAALPYYMQDRLDLSYGFWVMLLTIVGVAIQALCATLVFPVDARDQFFESLSRTLERLGSAGAQEILAVLPRKPALPEAVEERLGRLARLRSFGARLTLRRLSRSSFAGEGTAAEGAASQAAHLPAPGPVCQTQSTPVLGPPSRFNWTQVADSWLQAAAQGLAVSESAADEDLKHLQVRQSSRIAPRRGAGRARSVGAEAAQPGPLPKVSPAPNLPPGPPRPLAASPVGLPRQSPSARASPNPPRRGRSSIGVPRELGGPSLGVPQLSRHSAGTPRLARASPSAPRLARASPAGRPLVLSQPTRSWGMHRSAVVLRGSVQRSSALQAFTRHARAWFSSAATADALREARAALLGRGSMRLYSNAKPALDQMAWHAVILDPLRYEYSLFKRPHTLSSAAISQSLSRCSHVYNTLAVFASSMDTLGLDSLASLEAFRGRVRLAAEQFEECFRALALMLLRKVPVDAALALLDPLQDHCQRLLLEIVASGAAAAAPREASQLLCFATLLCSLESSARRLSLDLVQTMFGRRSREAARARELLGTRALGADLDAALVHRSGIREDLVFAVQNAVGLSAAGWMAAGDGLAAGTLDGQEGGEDVRSDHALSDDDAAPPGPPPQEEEDGLSPLPTLGGLRQPSELDVSAWARHQELAAASLVQAIAQIRPEPRGRGSFPSPAAPGQAAEEDEPSSEEPDEDVEAQR